MSSATPFYPASPDPVPVHVTAVSPGFRKEVKKVLAGIVYFVFIYLILLLASLLLIAICGYLGLLTVVNIGHFLGILGGIGLAGLGVMVFIFLIKFIFSVNRVDRSGMLEVKESEQPELFAFIRQVASDAQAPLPGRIFLSADVNASVSYNSSFWSMFFPIRKNLTIGLGLVNCLTISEFKAVMAHEFGHFSQRSMKLGSYVYQVNMILHNMLFNNSGYSRMLTGWANLSWVFAIFSNITVQFARGIQAILTSTYQVVNKRYSSLSREMEFHADAVAASVSGSESLVTALRRLELAEAGMQTTLAHCSKMLERKKYCSNFYPVQRYAMLELAAELGIPLQNQLPQVGDDFISASEGQRVNVKDQWASHPATEDRVAALRNLNVVAELKPESPWILFRRPTELQEQLSRLVYGDAINNSELQLLSVSEIERELKDERQKVLLPQSFNGFFDNRVLTEITEEELQQLEPDPTLSWLTVFDPEKKGQARKLAYLNADIELLAAIESKEIKTETFDFDGGKYPSAQAGTILEQLRQEKEMMIKEIAESEKRMIQLTMQLAESNGSSAIEVRELYRQFFQWQRELREDGVKVQEMVQSLAPIFQGVALPNEQISAIVSELKDRHEPTMMRLIGRWRDRKAFAKLDTELLRELHNFESANRVYFTGEEFLEGDFEVLNRFTGLIWDQLGEFMYERQLMLIRELDGWRPKETVN
ncbi:MAG: M48 family metallopeptidase [Chitinophagaceae bacterium]